MKNLFELLKKTNRLIFTSSSLSRSEMNWNYAGDGRTVVNVEGNKIYFLDRITLDEKLSYEDKKLWVFKEDEVEFWHDRGNSYEKIFINSILEIKPKIIADQLDAKVSFCSLLIKTEISARNSGDFLSRQRGIVISISFTISAGLFDKIMARSAI